MNEFKLPKTPNGVSVAATCLAAVGVTGYGVWKSMYTGLVYIFLFDIYYK